MWNYLKSLFCKNTPEVIEEKPENKLDISEPVISFVETYKDNPKRFKLSEKYEIPSDEISSNKVHYILTDLQTGNIFEVARVLGFSSYYEPNYNLMFLTRDELDFIFNTIGECYKKRKKIAVEYKKNKQRNRYIKDYCKEGL